MLKSLKSTGKGAVILPHGVLFRGNSEAVIRKEIIKRGYIKGIIGLPANLFYGTGIPACILILDKENAQARTGIFMIDASKGFEKDGPKNRLRAQDIHKIVDTFTRQTEVPRYARMVSVAEISDPKNDYNLNLPRYIDSAEPEDIQDIDGHLRGGIPERDIDALDRYWQIMPNLRATLFKKSPHPGYYELEGFEVKLAIFGHPEFTAFKTDVDELFAKWKATNAPRLKGFAADATSSHPKALIEVLSEDLLAAFALAPLLDRYAIYQHLMDYWAETMQDDCYLITADGWVDAAKPRLMVDDKNQKTKEKPDLIVSRKKYKTELIPAALVIARYCAKEQAVVEKLETDIGALQQQMEELAEEHGGEGGLLEDAKNRQDKLTKASVAARLKDVKTKGDSDGERKLMAEYLALSKEEAIAKTALKAEQESLAEKVFQQYAQLTSEDIRTFVVVDKWLASLADAVQGELDRVSQTLTTRVRELTERYATPLPQLAIEVTALANRVDEHLKKMGAV
jgi:type I restriction enzyme M protein